MIKITFINLPGILAVLHSCPLPVFLWTSMMLKTSLQIYDTILKLLFNDLIFLPPCPFIAQFYRGLLPPLAILKLHWLVRDVLWALALVLFLPVIDALKLTNCCCDWQMVCTQELIVTLTAAMKPHTKFLRIAQSERGNGLVCSYARLWTFYLMTFILREVPHITHRKWGFLWPSVQSLDRPLLFTSH